MGVGRRVRSARKSVLSAVFVYAAVVAIFILGSCGVAGVICSMNSSEIELSARKAQEQTDQINASIELQRAIQKTSLDEAPAELVRKKSANKDVCAWLVVPDTLVSLPIAQRVHDDSYYLNHDVGGEENSLGCAYITSANSPYFIDPVTVVYGHSFSDVTDVMMGTLSMLGEKGFFDAHDSFAIVLEDRVLTYRIANVCGFVGDNILDYLAGGDESRLNYYMSSAIAPGIDKRFERDVGKVGYPESRIVHLSTCVVPNKDEGRFVVTGILVEEEMLSTESESIYE